MGGEVCTATGVISAAFSPDGRYLVTGSKVQLKAELFRPLLTSPGSAQSGQSDLVNLTGFWRGQYYQSVHFSMTPNGVSGWFSVSSEPGLRTEFSGNPPIKDTRGNTISDWVWKANGVEGVGRTVAARDGETAEHSWWNGQLRNGPPAGNEIISRMRRE